MTGKLNTRLHRFWYWARWSWVTVPRVHWDSGYDHTRHWNTTGAVIINDDGESIAHITPRWKRSVFK